MKRVILGFVAGFIGVLVFHQIASLILHLSGITPNPPWRITPVPPLGVPQVISAAFWGGLWGVALALVMPRRWGPMMWVTGLAFGAVLPTLVGWFVIAPLRGQPIAQGWQLSRMWIGPLLNGTWGLGAAILYSMFTFGAGRARG